MQGIEAGPELRIAQLAVARAERLQRSQGAGRVVVVELAVDAGQVPQRQVERIALGLGQFDDLFIAGIGVAQVAAVDLDPAQQAQVGDALRVRCAGDQSRAFLHQHGAGLLDVLFGQHADLVQAGRAVSQRRRRRRAERQRQPERARQPARRARRGRAVWQGGLG